MTNNDKRKQIGTTANRKQKTRKTSRLPLKSKTNNNNNNNNNDNNDNNNNNNNDKQ